MNRYFLAKSEAEITAFHPGPAADFRFPERAPRTPEQRLADDERRFLDKALDLHARRDGDLAAMARSIIVQRAAFADASARGK